MDTPFDPNNQNRVFPDQPTGPAPGPQVSDGAHLTLLYDKVEQWIREAAGSSEVKVTREGDRFHSSIDGVDIDGESRTDPDGIHVTLKLNNREVRLVHKPVYGWRFYDVDAEVTRDNLAKALADALR